MQLASKGPTVKRAVTIAAAILAVLAFSGCSTAGPAPTKTAKTMTPDASKSQVMNLFEAIQKEVGGNWNVGAKTWDECKSSAAAPSAQFTLAAERNSQPLAGTPDEVAARVRSAIERHGYAVKVQHDPTLTPPRAVIGFPRGYLQGNEPDGFGFLFSVGDNFVHFDMTGHCVPGDSYFLETGKHL